MLPAMDQIPPPLKFCPDCAAQMPDSAGFCPGCGRSMRVQPPRRVKSAAPQRNWAGALAYFTFLPAVLFLLLHSSRRNSFLRFHSMQCLLCWLLGVGLAALLRLLNLVLIFIPVVGPLLSFLMVVIVSFAALLTWIVLLIKAFQGERFALPLIGAIAERYSGVV